MKSKKFKTILSLIVCLLLIFPHFQKAKCMKHFKPNYDLIMFSLSIPKIDEKVDELSREYAAIISNQYTLGDQYSKLLINWRKKVIEYFKFLKEQERNIYMASYFVWSIFMNKFNNLPYLQQTRSLDELECLNNLVDIKAYLVTPENQEYVMLKNIADDPNGSIQVILYYKYERPQIICL